MYPPSNGSGTYQIDLSPHIVGRIRALHRDAVAAGRGAEFRAALRRLLGRLRGDPFGCGEPVYPLRALGLTIRLVIDPPIALHFAAHPQRRVVWISAINLLG